MTVDVPGYGEVDVVFSEAEAVQLVQMFQQGFLDRGGLRKVHPSYPALTITGADIAHGLSSGVLVQTAEIGSLVLTFAPHLADHLKSEIDRANAANLERQQKQ